jgi:hypothetical protein
MADQERKFVFASDDIVGFLDNYDCETDSEGSGYDSDVVESNNVDSDIIFDTHTLSLKALQLKHQKNKYPPK